ncbi:iron-containing alcohol dehydrogenase [Paratissierella segnis]|uniref:Iron-containing alcohol dehydrogenase n=1 Tax=Paratissierella segnis TaxID=2763679 RepID=A0A926IL23_9FIRM|nr:iron-containing alcohol dehydrogenase [Paratissierella segnis]MBC8588915.1 iron-containing alcohol dehydrogenase [Paratissierella segnis]
MKNFDFQCKTRLIFGENSVKELKNMISGNYKNILLHYGGGSIKKYGLYNQVIQILGKENVNVFELSGVEPNPKLSLVKEGIKISRENNIDLILAVGGGSVIDSAKAIGIGAKYEEDVWDFFTGKAEPKESLPVGVILTIPATGSETSTGSVITNEDGLYKRSLRSNEMRPVFAIMDPKLTLTLPDKQTFAGIMDMLSHIFERYFTNTPNVDFIDHMSEGAMKSIIKNAYALKKDPQNYNARSEIMLAGTIAHNGVLGIGREEDWASHKIGHEIGALYGETHGVTLAIVFPAWMKYVYKVDIDRFIRFATKVFDVSAEGKNKNEIVLEGIGKFEDFLHRIGLPTSFIEGNLPTDKFELMADKATEEGPIGSFKKLFKEDVANIYKLAL